jgi:hypothetical protein
MPPRSSTANGAPSSRQEERNWVWGVIGKRAAQRLSDEAMRLLSPTSQDSDLHDDHAGLEGARRAARRQLAAGAGSHRRHGREARQDPAWVYWRARALLAGPSDGRPRRSAPAAGGHCQRARLSTSSWRWRSWASASPCPRARAPDRRGKGGRQPEPRPEPRAVRHPIGLRSEGVREWNYTTNLHARRHGRPRAAGRGRLGLPARGVGPLHQHQRAHQAAIIDLTSASPCRIRDAVVQRAQQIGLDPAYVYGLIRQESRFIMDARSGVGASGLMQVMPATARWTAKQDRPDQLHADQITDRDTNIAIGTGYLKLVLDDFAGSMPWPLPPTTRAPGRPRSWRNGPVLEAPSGPRTCPSTETRDYVKKVLSNTTNYAAILTGQPQSLKARLGTVGRPPRRGLPCPRISRSAMKKHPGAGRHRLCRPPCLRKAGPLNCRVTVPTPAACDNARGAEPAAGSTWSRPTCHDEAALTRLVPAMMRWSTWWPSCMAREAAFDQCHVALPQKLAAPARPRRAPAGARQRAGRGAPTRRRCTSAARPRRGRARRPGLD